MTQNGGATAGDAAYIAFNRAGQYAGLLGIDTDNQWKVGGWSMGANSYKLLHEGNSFSLATAGWLTTPSSISAANVSITTAAPGYGYIWTKDNDAYHINSGGRNITVGYGNFNPQVTINGAAATPTLALDTTQAAGTQHALNFTNATKLRWQVRDSAATFAFANYDDAGTYLGDSWQLDRTTRTFYAAGPYFYPRNDNVTVIGAGSLRFTAVYAVTGTIQTSDARMKKDIADSTLGLSFIESLRPVSYKWIVGKNIAEPVVDDSDAPMKITPIPGVRTHWGLLAQEVQQAVTAAGVDFGGYVEDKDDAAAPLGLNYSEFIAPLIKAVQELSARVKELEARLA